MDKKTILLVDDIPANIDVLNAILGADYNIKAATKGETVLKIAGSRNPPDMILLDVMMPGMDGFDVCKQLKQSMSTRNIPVIFVTARNESVDEARGFELGGIDYIPKPVSPSIVRARVRTHLALIDQNRELEQKVRQRTAELHDTRLEIIRRLGRAAEYKDNETGLHVIRMSKYCYHIALSSGLSSDHAELILNAAPMHDIGKIGIADRILLKPGPLTDEEWMIMKMHAPIGAKIIGEHPSEILREAATAAISHHEKWNGTGYPLGLSGYNIPLIGRIVAIADVFDALTNERPYKKAWTVDEALELIKSESGKHFDPELVHAFIDRMQEVMEIREEYADK